MTTITNHPTWQKVREYVNSLKNLDEGTRWALDVFNGKVKMSKMVFYQIARHLLFLYKSKHDSKFPYIYSKGAGLKLVEFSKNIIVPETMGPFVFPDFRKFICYFILGWRHKDNPNKLLTVEIFEVAARKQWKSSFYAMLMLAVVNGLLGDGNPSVYIAGPQKDTSRIPYDIARNYIIKSPKIQHLFYKNNQNWISTVNGGIIKNLAFEKAALEGKNPTMIILTEYHLHKDDTMQESAKTSKNLSRINQLIIYDTTKGHNINGVCYDREMKYKDFLIEQIERPDELARNPSIFLFCSELDADEYENWRNPELWYQANPALGVSVSLEDIMNEYHSITSPSSEIEFQLKRVGMWIGAANAHFPLAALLNSNAANKEKIKNYDLRNYNGIIGLDLAQTNDTTAVVVNFELDDGAETISHYIPHIFIPNGNLANKEKYDKINYTEWARKGYVTITDGDRVDLNQIIDYIKDLKTRYNIKLIGYDDWSIDSIKMKLEATFHPNDVRRVPEGVKLTPTFKEFEHKLYLKKISFEAEELFINHTTNVKIKQTLTSNILIQKIKATSRIDVFMAAIVASNLRSQVPARNKSPLFYAITPSDIKNEVH